MSDRIYILSNPAMPGIVKIGRTSRSAAERVAELSSHTGVPTGFVLVQEYSVPAGSEAERTVHEHLAAHRLAGNREFFRLEAEEAVAAVEAVLRIHTSLARRDFAMEERLLKLALPVVRSLQTVRPQLLEERLGVEYQTALLVISLLKARGIINERHEVAPGWRAGKPPTMPTRTEPSCGSEGPPDSAYLAALSHAVSEALGNLRDPDTGEPVEVRFDSSTEPPSLLINASGSVIAEAQARLERVVWPEMPPTSPPLTDLASSRDQQFAKARKPARSAVAQPTIIGNYQLPSLDLLQLPDNTVRPTESKEELMANARLMQQTLAQFDITITPGDITKGPTFTRYELHPAPGVKLERIVALTNNLAAALKAERIHILAPMPGKGAVGIEVPNPIKTKVIMRDLLESDEWRNTKCRIPIALGKDVYGHPIIQDLAEMPHLLIAGSTGSGKSNFMHTLMASLLYRFGPDQLRFVMADPRVVELQYYNRLPHLVIPVVTDPKKVVLTLHWVVNEMEKRYQIFSKVGVHDLRSYNQRSKARPNPTAESEPRSQMEDEVVEQGVDAFADEAVEETMAVQSDEIVLPEKLIYVLVVIDSFGDIVGSSPAELHEALDRITGEGHAAGIHLVLGTQHPDSDSLPEGIKWNIPSRIAFRAGSPVHSRLILGQPGAEGLSGKGDLLFQPPGSAKLLRCQSALITDQEIQGIVDFIAKQGKPNYEPEITQQLAKCEDESTGEEGAGEDEEIIQDCVAVIRSEQKASVSLLQRRLRLRYGRAARIMDELEHRGIVGPSKGAEPRDILIDLDDGSARAGDENLAQG
jgi:S-DNA-T family DNA segregation ATPase FtsK/SpoIIIE